MRADRTALPKPGNGRPPVGLQRMLRMYFVQHLFNLADEACEEALLDSTALRRFVGIDLGCERVSGPASCGGQRQPALGRQSPTQRVTDGSQPPAELERPSVVMVSGDGLMGSVLFVHGTGVREDGYRATVQRITRGLQAVVPACSAALPVGRKWAPPWA